MRTVDDMIMDNGYTEEDEIIVFRSPDYATALIGISDNHRAIYDYELMIEFLVENEEMDYMEAADFISYNSSFSSCMPGNAPIIMYPLV